MEGKTMPIYTGAQLNELIKNQSINAVKISVKELIDIYQDNWDHIIRAELRDQFSQTTYDYMKWLITKEMNLLKRVINEISVIYKKPAERKAIIKSKDREGIEVLQEDEVYAEAIDKTNIDIVLNKVNQYTNLLNNVLVKTVWRDKRIEFDIINFDNAEIYTHIDDWTKIIAIKYYVGIELPYQYNGAGSERGYKSRAEGGVYNLIGGYETESGVYIQKYDKAYLYTLEDIEDQESGIIAKKGYIYEYKQVNGSEELTGKEENPYRDIYGNVILPFTLFQKDYPIDQLLNFTCGNDLRDANMNIAMSLIHLNNLLKYQSYKQVWLKSEDMTKVPKKLRLDPAAVLKLESEKSEVGVIDLQTAIDKHWTIINSRILMILSN